MTDEQYAELRSFYSEGEIVELLCAIGLFNYFNRFNNALKMEPTKPGEADPERLRNNLPPQPDKRRQTALFPSRSHSVRKKRKWEFFFLMNLKLPPGDFRAYLFDCDGTIADSMPLHYKAWKKALAEYGCTYDEDLFTRGAASRSARSLPT